MSTAQLLLARQIAEEIENREVLRAQRAQGKSVTAVVDTKLETSTDTPTTLHVWSESVAGCFYVATSRVRLATSVAVYDVFCFRPDTGRMTLVSRLEGAVNFGDASFRRGASLREVRDLPETKKRALATAVARRTNYPDGYQRLDRVIRRAAAALRRSRLQMCDLVWDVCE